MNLIKDDRAIYDVLLGKCLEMFEAEENISVIDMAVNLMDYPEVPMHYPYHHFIVPAVLLTSFMKAKGMPEDELQENLEEAIKRSQNVLGGFCGNYGTCGAAVGMGIFMSIITDTTPLSDMTWSWVNEATGICLQEISRIPGPRCCKRTVFIVLKAAVPIIKEKLGIQLPIQDQVSCKYYTRNAECKKDSCPFYKKL